MKCADCGITWRPYVVEQGFIDQAFIDHDFIKHDSLKPISLEKASLRNLEVIQNRSVVMRTVLLLVASAAMLIASAVSSAQRGTDVTFLNSGKVLPSTLPFSEAVRVGDVVYLSGQIGILPGTMKIVDGGMAAEARQTMDNIQTVLQAHGYAMSDLVKCTVMLADMAEWGAFNEVYKGYFTDHFPARSAFGANGLALGARVEVECIATVRR